MKQHFLLSLFACAALAGTFAGCGSSEEEVVPAVAKPAPGPADVARAFFDAFKAKDQQTVLANGTEKLLRKYHFNDKEEFENIADKIKTATVTLGNVRADGDVARIEYVLKRRSREEACVMKLLKSDGVWKIEDVDDSDIDDDGADDDPKDEDVD